ncbi:methyltransferase domain-containing protein [Streptomyces sp. BR123]|uniref:class I SAM-dependent methyltransferase n=1 Tax=Streptomyces sp. BR123 TaxID=2749828 RepID=UPI0015C4301D|nr:class I SAM-dependent methyltransferase [Streptomyces sp. BR123]NXY94992.1 methyltransferase domain-containing protein [Streptomyces sp. BR123]
MDDSGQRDGVAANRAVWDELARVHGTTSGDRFYDVESFLAGRQTLWDLERELAGDVRGLDLLHLQCHSGMNTPSWARLGARVTGVDFSPVAVERARGLAARAGLAERAEFVEADTQALPASLGSRFDLAVATYGVLCWIGDLDAWMRGAAAALRPGGRLVMVDLHPLYQVFASYEPLVADWPYGGGLPQREPVTGTYADPELRTEPRESVQYPHTLGEIVTAAAGAGLAVERLGEHTDAESDGRGILPRGQDGRYRFPFGQTHLPALYSLVARRPAAATG